MEIDISIVALVISVISAVIAIYAICTERKMTRYTYLANKWYEIKGKEFENPDFTNSSKTSLYNTSFTGDSLKKYEIFAWTCWAHAEDVYLNKWHKDPGFKPTLKWYKSLHYNWLKKPENSKRFDPSFIKYIDEVKIN